MNPNDERIPKDARYYDPFHTDDVSTYQDWALPSEPVSSESEQNSNKEEPVIEKKSVEESFEPQIEEFAEEQPVIEEPVEESFEPQIEEFAEEESVIEEKPVEEFFEPQIEGFAEEEPTAEIEEEVPPQSSDEEERTAAEHGNVEPGANVRTLAQCIDLRVQSERPKKTKIIIESTFPVVDPIAPNDFTTDGSSGFQSVPGASAMFRPSVGEPDPANPSLDPLYIRRFAPKNPALFWDDYGDLPLEQTEPKQAEQEVEEPEFDIHEFEEHCEQHTPEVHELHEVHSPEHFHSEHKEFESEGFGNIDPQTLQSKLDASELEFPELHELYEPCEVSPLEHFHSEHKEFESEEFGNIDPQTLQSKLDASELEFPELHELHEPCEISPPEHFHSEHKEFEFAELENAFSDTIDLESLEMKLCEWGLQIPDLSDAHDSVQIVHSHQNIELNQFIPSDYPLEVPKIPQIEPAVEDFVLYELQLREWGLEIPDVDAPNAQKTDILEFFEPQPHAPDLPQWIEAKLENEQDREFFEHLAFEHFAFDHSVSPLESFGIEDKPITLERLSKQEPEQQESESQEISKKFAENEQFDQNKGNSDAQNVDKIPVNAQSALEVPKVIPFPDAKKEPVVLSKQATESTDDYATNPKSGTTRVLAFDVNQPPILEVRNLTVQFGKTFVLKKIDIQVRRGETVAVIGESGCGKTVLLKTMIGLLTPLRGEVIFDGVNIGTLSDRELAKQRIRYGFVFQQAALFDSMSISENIAFPLRQHTDYTDEEIMEFVNRLLEEVGLPKSVLEKKPAELSGGMRKRVGFARALALGPEIMLYDEPTTGLDPIMSDVLNELMLRAREHHDVSGVMVTHDMNSAKKVADRIIMLYPLSRLRPGEPQIIFNGTPEEIEKATDPRVSQFLRGEARDRIYEGS